ncbi:MarR family transcriptional regulator [Loigolactobacillus backii]|uniref:MarR family winged helix-turn-helix transcriptional regulator n=1 Tax=Loigolactobacillus TaxID=2767889 RepID=UPI000C1C8CCD|nr:MULTISPECIES: MarR family transcriptional regulator [Loigolactobacillus]PIO82391.1 MarR family transcriptional regulator [Loigolactobacillus backii]
MNNTEIEIKDLILSLRSLRKETRRIFYYQANKQQLTETWIIALGALATKNPSSLEELANALRLGNSTTSGIVDRMVAEGLVTKNRDQTNKRKINISPTAKGQQKYAVTYADFWKKLTPINDMSTTKLTELLATQAELLKKLEGIK